MLKNLDDQTNWNTLFLNPNTVLSEITQRYNIKKVFDYYYLFFKTNFMKNYYKRKISSQLKLKIKQLKYLLLKLK